MDVTTSQDVVDPSSQINSNYSLNSGPWGSQNGDYW